MEQALNRLYLYFQKNNRSPLRKPTVESIYKDSFFPHKRDAIFQLAQQCLPAHLVSDIQARSRTDINEWLLRFKALHEMARPSEPGLNIAGNPHNNGNVYIAESYVDQDLKIYLFENGFLGGIHTYQAEDLHGLPNCISSSCNKIRSTTGRMYLYLQITSAPPEWSPDGRIYYPSYHHIDIQSIPVAPYWPTRYRGLAYDDELLLQTRVNGFMAIYRNLSLATRSTIQETDRICIQVLQGGLLGTLRHNIYEGDVFASSDTKRRLQESIVNKYAKYWHKPPKDPSILPHVCPSFYLPQWIEDLVEDQPRVDLG